MYSSPQGAMPMVKVLRVEGDADSDWRWKTSKSGMGLGESAVLGREDSPVSSHGSGSWPSHSTVASLPMATLKADRLSLGTRRCVFSLLIRKRRDLRIRDGAGAWHGRGEGVTTSCRRRGRSKGSEAPLGGVASARPSGATSGRAHVAMRPDWPPSFLRTGWTRFVQPHVRMCSGTRASVSRRRKEMSSEPFHFSWRRAKSVSGKRPAMPGRKKS